MKKIISTIVILSTSLCSANVIKAQRVGKEVRSNNPLEKDLYIKVINDNLVLSSEAGQHVDAVRQSGESARDILKNLHRLHSCQNVNDIVTLRNELIIGQLKDDIVKEALKSKGIDISAKCVNKDDLIKETVEVLKNQLIAPKAEFFSLLHGFATILKEPVRKSLSSSKAIDVNKSILLGFFETSVAESSKYFDTKIGSDPVVLKKACSELIIFCSHFWKAMSPQLKHKRHVWLQEQEELRNKESKTA